MLGLYFNHKLQLLWYENWERQGQCEAEATRSTATLRSEEEHCGEEKAGHKGDQGESRERQSGRAEFGRAQSRARLRSEYHMFDDSDSV